MKKSDKEQSASEIKLELAYTLLSNGFADLSAAFARTDQNAAWGMLATIHGQIARSVREENSKLTVKGYPPDELKEISDRLNQTILTAGRAINAQQNLPAFASLVREALGESKNVACWSS
jgi:hypothetical protein